MSQVTYLICNYNGQKWIDKAIKSAQNQTVDCNICVVDDGSTDDSHITILKTLFTTKKFKSIKTDDYCIHSDDKNTFIELYKNQGPSFARNVGIENTLSKTKYYAILDADDENYPNKVEKCVKILDEHPNVSIVYADYDIYNTRTGNTLREYKKSYSRSHLIRECIIHSGSVIRASVLNSVREPSGWYDINLRCCEDWSLWLRMTEKSIAWHIPESLSFVRSHENDSTSSVPSETWKKCWAYVAQKTQLRLQNANRNK